MIRDIIHHENIDFNSTEKYNNVNGLHTIKNSSLVNQIIFMRVWVKISITVIEMRVKLAPPF